MELHCTLEAPSSLAHWLSRSGGIKERAAFFSPCKIRPQSASNLFLSLALCYPPHPASSALLSFMNDLYVGVSAPSSSLSLSCWLFIMADGLLRTERRGLQAQRILFRAATASLLHLFSLFFFSTVPSVKTAFPVDYRKTGTRQKMCRTLMKRDVRGACFGLKPPLI